jgi:endonuclease/exonuclease/phosphatase family metal-dependent hydrolase
VRLAVLLMLALAACGRAPRERPDGGTPDGGTPPPLGYDGGGLRVGGWNVEFLGDALYGPDDEELQLRNVRSVLADAGFDVVGLVEVVEAGAFQRLLADLPEYGGVLASDTARVVGAASCGSGGASPCYTTFEQKPALLYRRSLAAVRSAELILTESGYFSDLAGRPPLRVDLDVARDGGAEPLVVIVLHLKAYATYDDWVKRRNASGHLKAYLDARLPDEKVMVIGDWNDDLDQSTARDPGSPGQYLPSPFENFLQDAARYRFVTDVLTEAGQGTTVGYGSTIDHHLVTNELEPQLVPGSVTVLHPEQWGDPAYAGGQYRSTTSDHWPVGSAFEW